MGYGGSRKDAGQAIGQVGDGGIDGIIKEDKLGLDAIYLQAKRWEGTVGGPEGNAARLPCALRQFREEQVQPRSDQRSAMGRSDLGGDDDRLDELYLGQTLGQGPGRQPESVTLVETFR